MLFAAHWGSIASGGGAGPRYVFGAIGSSPYIEAYQWGGAGWGTKYSNPAILPTGAGSQVAVTYADDAVALAHSTSPFVTAYPWTAAGFGTKYTNPTTAVLNTGAGIAFKPDDTAVVIGNRTTTVYVQAYAFSSASGFGSRFTQPTTTTNNSTYDVDWQGNYIARSNSGTSNIEAFLWSSGWSTRSTFAEANSVQPIKWMKGSTANVAYAPTASPFIKVVSFTTTFGSAYTNPGTLPTGNVYGISWAQSNTQIAMAHTNSPYVTGYPFSGSGFGTKYADPTTALPGNGKGIDIAGDVAVIGHSTSPFASAYGFTANGWGGKYADPAVLPTAQFEAVALGV
mgnify:CR=1 FL=1